MTAGTTVALPKRSLALRYVLVALFSLGITGVPSSSSTVDLRGVVRVGDRVAGDAVVWLDASGARPAATEGRMPTIEQRNLSFSPRVMVVRVGTRIEFPNNDRVFHNVFSFHNGKRFDLGLYPTGAVRKVLFDQPGLSRLFCNIHPNMAGYVVSVDSPYFGLSDHAGNLAIAEVPAGTYVWHAWRAGGTPLTASVVVDAGSTLEVRWP